MKTRILSGWTLQRWLRLVFVGVFLYAGIHSHEPVALLAAAFFGVQALFNVGCCGVDACRTLPARPASTTREETVDHEEIR